MTLLTWIGVIRFAPAVLHLSLAVPWMLSVFLVAGTLLLQHYLEQVEAANEVAPYACQGMG
jgi:hypothetical protein